MNNEQILKLVRDFADQAHGKQLRRYSSDRYIVHPERVMKTCAEYTDDVSMLAAALLHDVLEDTSTTKDEIKDFLQTLLTQEVCNRTLQYVTELTDVFIKKDYPSLNRSQRKQMEAERLSKVSVEAQTIKYADVIDNVGDVIYEDEDFARVYVKECKALLLKMNKGDALLYDRATQTVLNCLAEVR